MKADIQEAKKLSRAGSEVAVHDKGGNVFKGLTVWCDMAPAVKKDPGLLYAKCLVLPGSTPQKIKLRQVEPADPEQIMFEAPQQNVYNCNTNIDPLVYPDIGMIPHTNSAAVLDFIHQRFQKGFIYCTADPLLLAVNPFKNLGNATEEVIRQYRDIVDHTKLPPHVFATAREALENLHTVKKSQTIIVSGESGAGKTEATKQVMRYFAAARGGAADLRIQRAVLAGNPVLEAFGNAKTIRNNNSSRFGRFMQLQVGVGGGIEYGYVKNFLLEMSRIVKQEGAERNYHIFYQVLKGLDAAEKNNYKVGAAAGYKCINPASLDAPGIDDVADMKEVKESLRSMGLGGAQIQEIFKVVSAVMHLSNVQVGEGSKSGVSDAAKIMNPEVFKVACDLLQIEPNRAMSGLTDKITTVQGKDIQGVFTKAECEVLINSMGKAVYNSLFNWIVEQLNKGIKPPEGFTLFMGMLDIFGFEVFANNSLEQFFINVTNEMLQKNFVDVVFDRELKLYRSEGISAADLKWTTNAPIIQLLCAKKGSIVTILEDTCLGPAPDDKKFNGRCNSELGSHPNYGKAMIDAEANFIVTHTIGPIQYCSKNFISKNKDMLKPELVDVMLASKSEVVAQLFKDVVVQKGKIGREQLISAVFLSQLSKLMELINSTEPHFIRCLKPNEEKLPLHYTPAKVLVQLHALSILEALQLRNLGFSYRRPFEEFIRQFKFLDVGVTEDKSLAPKDAAIALLKGSGLDSKQYQVGHTMIFLKHDATKYLTLRQRELMAAWEPLISVLECMYRNYAVQQELKTYELAIIRLQSHIRAGNDRR